MASSLQSVLSSQFNSIFLSEGEELNVYVWGVPAAGDVGQGSPCVWVPEAEAGESPFISV